MSKIAAKIIRLEKELKSYNRIMAQAADTIMDEGVSIYPIFIVHQLEVDLGIPLIERGATPDRKWSVNASSLEELTAKNVIQPDKVEDFRRIYKDPKEYFCLFVLSDLGAQFIFLPRT